MKSPGILAHLKAILVLPFTVTVIIPFVLVYFTQADWNPLNTLPPVLSGLVGLFFFLGGLILFIRSVRLFIKIGKGTLAPWNPPQKLVIKSLYRYTRNPMISGVLFMLLGESFIFRSTSIFLWTSFFFLLNNFYFSLQEEPGLLKRFGAEYQAYKENVPRWIPRWNAWRPEAPKP